MFSSNVGKNGTIIVPGPNLIQASDFYLSALLLHPLVIGSIAVICLFTYLRISSNRTIAHISVFDWLINVAFGSTLAGIVNGNSLVRGLSGLVTMLAFQFLTSFAASNFHENLAWLFSSPPLIIAFRGHMLKKGHAIASYHKNRPLWSPKTKVYHESLSD